MTPVQTRRLGWSFLAAVVLSALAPAALAEKSVLRLRLSGPLSESPNPAAEFAVLFGQGQMDSLYDLTKRIRDAAADDSIHGLALVVEQPVMSFAQIEEVTAALQAFRAKGKPVHAFLDYAGNGSYALAAAADHITLAEYSQLDIAGLNAELSFYRKMLDKIGVSADMLHCGDYKAAYEPYVHTEPSAPFRENMNWLLDGIYERWIELMAEGRKLSADEIKAAVDRAPIDAADALEHKLVDAVGTFEDFRRRIHKEFGDDVQIVKNYPRSKSGGLDLDTSDPFSFMMQFQEVMEEIMGTGKDTESPGIGLVYVDGPIMVGKSEPDPFGGSSSAGSTTIRAALHQALEDPRVKAVVLRVNSPGGSALASDIIWNAASAVAAKKPLVVSMGGVAGSGGYYVALPGDKIFADAATITASIGVVGGKLVWTELWEEKIGITTTGIQRGKMAHLMSPNQPWSESERSHVQDMMDRVYTQFKGRVTQSRGDRLKLDLDEMAGGRVFTGRQALERGLIDELGTLHDAIAYAAQKASLTKPEVYVFPDKKDVFEELLAKLLKQDTRDEFEISLGGFLAGRPGGSLGGLLDSALPLVRKFAPQRVDQVLTDLRNLEMLHRERIGMFVPLGGLTVR